MGFLHFFKKPNSMHDTENLSLDEDYRALRELALHTKPADLHLTLKENEEVYAAVVDMNLGGKIVSLVCSTGGATSLYFSTGGGYIGLGEKYQAIAKKSVYFLENAPLVFPIMGIANNLDLPMEYDHKIFLLTQKHLYSTVYTKKEMSESHDNIELHFLFTLYNTVLDTIRESMSLQNAQKE